jgi:uncharacterized lipoprotein YddW (UPF0748 family)
MFSKNTIYLLLLAVLFGQCSPKSSKNKRILHAEITSPKREFRAAWIATVANIDWPSKKGLSSDIQKREFTQIINTLNRTGINAVLVQVRAASDALYAKSNEPWSEWLTGKQGQPPVPFYDPMEFMIEETHSRDMEFHAWLNLNRGTHKASDGAIAKNHITKTKPEWFLTYDGQQLFNFGLPEVREYILDMVMNIVRNYDVDGIHFDDYFYPYTVTGQTLKDGETYRRYGKGFSSVEDWRRNNLDLLIHDIGKAIEKEKRWVKFGVSPFAVWRNKSADPAGSDTDGGQPSYDNLYADTRKWARAGWIDYIAPQNYFSFEHDKVPYQPTSEWWSRNHGPHHLYIGHSTYRADIQNPDRSWANPNQIPRQIQYNRKNPEISGSIFYNTSSLLKNNLGVRDSLANYFRLPALLPAMPWKDNTPPNAPEKLRLKKISDSESEISWSLPEKPARDKEDIRRFIIYRFDHDETANLSNPARILAIVKNNGALKYNDKTIVRKKRYYYAITALDRLQNESQRSDFIILK